MNIDESLMSQEQQIFLKVLHAEYLEPTVTVVSLADKYDLPIQDLRKVIRDMGWINEKQQALQEMNQEADAAVDLMIAQQRIEKMEEMLSTSTKLIDKTKTYVETLDAGSIGSSVHLERASKVFKAMFDLQRDVLSIQPKTRSEVDVNVNTSGDSLMFGGLAPKRKCIDAECVDHSDD